MQATKICVISHRMRKMIDLDRFDRRLLDQVRVDNLQPARVLADKVGLSISAVLRRLRRRRADGVIGAHPAGRQPAPTGTRTGAGRLGTRCVSMWSVSGAPCP